MGFGDLFLGRGRWEPAVFARRREWVTDRTWYGLAFAIVGFAAAAAPGWYRLMCIPLILLGGTMLYLGVKRALSRIDPDSGEPRPGRPW
jgi:hypothetical protein